jgi:hypothetical protein
MSMAAALANSSPTLGPGARSGAAVNQLSQA